MKVENQAVLNDFAMRSLRDVADQDYIAARMSHRAGLDQQFLWLGLQSIEKYFKAILLFNGRKTKGLGHNLREALRQIEEIEDFRIVFPDDARKHIDFLHDYGPNRYLDYPTYMDSEALLFLDKAVWHVRRYCQNLRGTITRSDGAEVDRLPLEFKRLESEYYKKFPNRLRLSRGFLEKCIQENMPSCEPLIWKNFYFGRRHKKTIQYTSFRSSSVNPTPFMYDGWYDILAEYVDFPREMKDYFKQGGKAL